MPLLSHLLTFFLHFSPSFHPCAILVSLSVVFSPLISSPFLPQLLYPLIPFSLLYSLSSLLSHLNFPPLLTSTLLLSSPFLSSVLSSQLNLCAWWIIMGGLPYITWHDICDISLQGPAFLTERWSSTTFCLPVNCTTTSHLKNLGHCWKSPRQRWELIHKQTAFTHASVWVFLQTKTFLRLTSSPQSFWVYNCTFSDGQI